MPKIKALDIYCDIEALYRPIDEFKKYGFFPYYMKDYIPTDDEPRIVAPICVVGVHKQKTFVAKSLLELFDYIIIEYHQKPEFNIYFHYAPFDLNVALWELRYRKFNHYIKPNTNIRTYVSGKHHILRSNSIEVLGRDIESAGKVIIHYDGRMFNIFDTFKQYPSSLKNWGISMKCKNKKMEDIDFDTVHIKNDYDDILDRCVKDCLLLQEAHTKFTKLLKTRFKTKGTTSASISLRAYKEHLSNSINTFDDLYPALMEFENWYSKKTYSGGLVLCNPDIQGDIVHNITHIDITSSYPYAMTKPLPYGKPTVTKQIDPLAYNEIIADIDIELKHNKIAWFKVNDHVSVANRFGIKPNKKLYSRLEAPEKWSGVIALNCIDLEQLKLDYKFNKLKILRVHTYKTDTNLKDYIELLFKLKFEAKISGDTGLELCVKILLNSLYGKFAQDLTGNNKLYFVEDDAKTELYITLNLYHLERLKNELVFKHGEKNLEKADITQDILLTDNLKVELSKTYISIDEKRIYAPLASAVTAYGRKFLLTMIRKIGLKDFYYADTDGIYFATHRLNNILNTSIGEFGNNLGQWEVKLKDDKVTPENYIRGKFLGRKTYLLEKIVTEKYVTPKRKLQRTKESIQTIVKVVGLPKDYTHLLSIDNFNTGEKFCVKKMRSKVGGKAMVNTSFELKERAGFKF